MNDADSKQWGISDQLCKYCLFALQDVAGQQGLRFILAVSGHAGLGRTS